MKATQHRQPLRLRGRCAATACSSVQRPCPSATANAVTAAFSCSSLPVTGVPRTSQSRLGVDHHRQRRDSGPTRAPGECLAAPNSRGNGRCMASRGRWVREAQADRRIRFSRKGCDPAHPTTVEFQFIPHQNDTTYSRIAGTGFTGTPAPRSAAQSSPPPVSPSCSARRRRPMSTG
jgi:hypothetical protein